MFLARRAASGIGPQASCDDPADEAALLREGLVGVCHFSVRAQRRRDIAFVLCLEETSVVAMADGYAQASGRVGVVNLHSSGGLGHAMGAILAAQLARTPVVVNAGQQDMRHIGDDALLTGDCVSAWNKDPVSGVIGVQKGPL